LRIARQRVLFDLSRVAHQERVLQQIHAAMTVAEQHLKPKRRAKCAAVVLSASPDDRHIIEAALDGWDVDFRDRAREVLAALRTTGAPLFVTRPSMFEERAHAGLVQGIREDAPAFDIVALARSNEQQRNAGVAMTELGVGEVLVIDDPQFGEKLRDLVSRTRLSHRVADCGREVAAGLPGRVAGLVRWSFQRGIRCGSVSEFSAAKGVSTRNLREWLARFNVSPEELLRWRRVIAALVLFEHTLLTVDRVARRVGFPSGPALHNAIHRTAGVARSVVLREGGSTYLIGVLRKKMGL
jgi:AraC-like DNA-binding protein